MVGIGIGLGLGWQRGALASSSSVVPFAFEAETETYLTAAGASFPEKHEKWIDKLVKRLKGYGIWDKIDNLWVCAVEDSGDGLLNIKNPSAPLVNSGSSHTANLGWTGASLTTGVSTDVEMFGCYVYYNGVSLSSAQADMTGLKPKNTSNFIEYRGQNVGATAQTNGRGFFCVSHDAGNAYVYRDGVLVGSVTEQAPSGNFTIGSASGRTVHAAWTGSTLTAAEVRRLYGAIGDYIEAVRFGVYDYSNPGIGEAVVNADVVVYGTTPQGCIAAYEAARQGKNVVICGGWRDRMLGGTSAGGLGHMDVLVLDGYGGLPRWVLAKCNDYMGRPADNTEIEGFYFRYALRTLLDPSQNGGYDIPVYYSDGVSGADWDGTRITAITTEDGRRFEGLQFIDASYEGDLLWKSGITVTKGREAAGTGDEAYNGFRGKLTTAGGGNKQMKIGSTYYDISPFVIDGDSGSGYLPYISRSLADAPANGSADDQIQSYCFRQLTAVSALKRVPFTDFPLEDYDPLNYETLGRIMALHPTMQLLNCINFDPVRTNTSYDVNSGGGWSTNLWGGSKDYPAASYAEREVIWKRHYNHQMGFWYFLQYEDDARVPSAVRTDALTHGYHNEGHLDHHENDDVFFMPQLYVRECWRMVSDMVWDANDVTREDSEPGRSTKYIGIVSYALDSHHTESFHDPNSGNDRIWNSGNVEFGIPGDDMSPTPYDIIVPAVADCTNAFGVFAVSATHMAFGAIRMELSSMSLAQAAGAAAALSIDEDVDVQDLDYGLLASTLLASPSLSGEVPPVLDAPTDNITIIAEGATYEIAGGDADIVISGENVVIEAEGGSFVIAGGDADILVSSDFVDPSDVAAVDFWFDSSEVSDGSVPDFINEIPGNSNASQSDSGARPTASSGVITFTSDHLRLPEDFTAGVEFSGGVVITPSITGARRYIFDQSPGSTGWFLRIEQTTNFLSLLVFTNAGTIQVTTSTALVNETKYTVGFRVKSGAIQLYVNGSAISATSTTTFASIVDATGDTYIGASVAAAEAYSGTMQDIWLSYDTYVENDDFDNLMSYLATECSGSWTNL